MTIRKKHAPEPEVVHVTRERGLTNRHRHEKRSYFCRSCGKQAEGFFVPDGWYLLSRATGGGESHHRLGMYCSVPCVERQLPRIEGIEDDLGSRWREETARKSEDT